MNKKYSPNFTIPKRSKNKIKFIIIHYTGMKKESSALKRLCDEKSKVSAHYFIKKNGDLTQLVPDLYEAWHAGESGWKKIRSLNKYSIGIEIQNTGHDFKYENYSQKQINTIVKLLKRLLKIYNIDIKNILGHSDIAPNRKKDPGEKFPWKYLAKKKIGFWHTISNNLLKKNRKIKVNNEDKKLFFKNLYKIGYFKNFKKTHHLRLIVKAFQRRFRQELINGEIDKECLIISNNLLKKHY